MTNFFSVEDFTKMSESYYREIQETLEKGDKGKYVALDYEVKKYWVGDTASEVLTLAKQNDASKIYFVIQIGEVSAFSVQSVDVSNSKQYHGFKWAY